jgi:hypothetical protein
VSQRDVVTREGDNLGTRPLTDVPSEYHDGRWSSFRGCEPSRKDEHSSFVSGGVLYTQALDERRNHDFEGQDALLKLRERCKHTFITAVNEPRKANRHHGRNIWGTEPGLLERRALRDGLSNRASHRCTSLNRTTQVSGKVTSKRVERPNDRPIRDSSLIATQTEEGGSGRGAMFGAPSSSSTSSQ